VLPFQASADIKWHHPLALAAQPAARRLIASCHLGTIRVQPAFGHIGLLQALHQQMKAGTDAFEPVSQSGPIYQTAKEDMLLQMLCNNLNDIPPSDLMSLYGCQWATPFQMLAPCSHALRTVSLFYSSLQLCGDRSAAMRFAVCCRKSQCCCICLKWIAAMHNLATMATCASISRCALHA